MSDIKKNSVFWQRIFFKHIFTKEGHVQFEEKKVKLKKDAEFKKTYQKMSHRFFLKGV